MLQTYGLVFFDKEQSTWKHFFGLTKKECYKRIKTLQLGKDLISEIHVVRMIDAWNAYDGLYLKGGKICDRNFIH